MYLYMVGARIISWKCWLPPQLRPPQKNKNINGMQPAVKVNKPLVSGY